jgi:hypothetical protein
MSGKIHPPVPNTAADRSRSRARTEPPTGDRESMMRFFNAKVRGGRLTLDEPTELPDGTLIELVSTDAVVWLVQLDEQAPVTREFETSIVEAAAGQTFDLGKVLSGLRASHTQHEAPEPEVSHELTQSLKAHVQNRRLVLDEPTDLPDGTVVEVVPIEDVVASGGYFLDDKAQATFAHVLDRDALLMDSFSRKSRD